MEPTLLVGEHLLAKKLIFEARGCSWYQRALPYECIRRGDLLVFRLPVQDHPLYLKRVIGMPGDRIKIVNRSVYVNGQLQSESYVVHDPAFYYAYGDNFPPASADVLPRSVMSPEWAEQIPKYVQNGELAVPVGAYFVLGDNREHSWDSRYWGFVDHKAIFGRPVVIYWSATSAGVRWGRMFHAVY